MIVSGDSIRASRGGLGTPLSTRILGVVGSLSATSLLWVGCASPAPPSPRVVPDYTHYESFETRQPAPVHVPAEPIAPPIAPRIEPQPSSTDSTIDQTTYLTEGPVTLSPQTLDFDQLPAVVHSEETPSQLAELESLARVSNPRLRQLAQETQAAQARVAYIDRLPDPALAANGFASPIETAAGAQRANLSLSQMLPWLPRLDAQAQQACFEAVALDQTRASEELKVVADLRVAWYRLYVIQKQIEVNQSNQDVLQRLINVATSRVETDQASQGDVLAGSVELSRLEETMLVLRQRQASTQAEIARLVGESIDAPQGPAEITPELPPSTPEELQQLAYQFQPDIAAAETRVEAARWGIEVARLRRRPDITFNATWFGIDNNRPPSSLVNVGQDAWSVGAMVTLPINRSKYDAMAQEASWKHAAHQASVDDVKQRYDYLIRDLWEQASSASATARLYQDVILPQANQALDTDLLSYSNSEVEFDRVLQDFRNVLNLELSYHQALGQLASTLARLEQAVGTPLDVSSHERAH